MHAACPALLFHLLDETLFYFFKLLVRPVHSLGSLSVPQFRTVSVRRLDLYRFQMSASAGDRNMLSYIYLQH